MRYTLINVTFKRCLHATTPAQQAASKKVTVGLTKSFISKHNLLFYLTKVAMSKFEPNDNIPYDKMTSKLQVVRSR